MNNIFLTGKYVGRSFEEVLEMDLPYCEFMLSLKFVRKDFRGFIDWLQLNIDSARARAKLVSIAKIK